MVATMREAESGARRSATTLTVIQRTFEHGAATLAALADHVAGRR
jgi:hypothetical protein